MSGSNPGQLFWPQTAAEWLELMLKGIMLAAAVGAVYQYFDIKQENRVKETIVLLKEFNSDPLLAAQLKLTETWDAYREKIKQINLLSVAGEQERAQLQANIVLPVIRAKNLQRELSVLTDFFNNLQVCVQERICDRQSAQAFFSGYAGQFYRLHRPWIETQRSVTPGYACQLQAFANAGNAGCM